MWDRGGPGGGRRTGSVARSEVTGPLGSDARRVLLVLLEHLVDVSARDLDRGVGAGVLEVCPAHHVHASGGNPLVGKLEGPVLDEWRECSVEPAGAARRTHIVEVEAFAAIAVLVAASQLPVGKGPGDVLAPGVDP